jgi:hypothetical protein
LKSDWNGRAVWEPLAPEAELTWVSKLYFLFSVPEFYCRLARKAPRFKIRARPGYLHQRFYRGDYDARSDFFGRPFPQWFAWSRQAKQISIIRRHRDAS